MNRLFSIFTLLVLAPLVTAGTSGAPTGAAFVLPAESDALLATAPTPDNARRLAAHLVDPATRPHPNAAYAYALCVYYGIGVPVNRAEGFRLANLAGNHGCLEARAVAPTLEPTATAPAVKSVPTSLAQFTGMLVWIYSMEDVGKMQPIHLGMARYAASLGNAEAVRFCAGRDLRHGDPAQKEAAAKCLMGAAEAGDIEATLLYAGMNASRPDAERLLKQAAGKGSASACRVLAQRDWRNRESWFKRGMELGDASAGKQWAESVLGGTPSAEDAALAVAQLRSAIAAGDTSANATLARCHLRGIGMPKDTAAGIALLEGLAAKDGPNAAYYASQLGAMYEGGDGVPKDPAQALYWYQIAAEDPSSWSGHYTENLARCHARGIGVEKNPAEAERVLRAAAESHPAYWATLAQHYSTGDLIPADTAKADVCLREAAIRGGDAMSMLRLAIRLESAPNATPEHLAEAAGLRRQAVQKVRPNEASHLAFQFEHGHGGPANVMEAAYWFSRAAGGDDDSAKRAAESLEKLRSKLTLAELRTLKNRR